MSLPATPLPPSPSVSDSGYASDSPFDGHGHSDSDTELPRYVTEKFEDLNLIPDSFVAEPTCHYTGPETYNSLEVSYASTDEILVLTSVIKNDVYSSGQPWRAMGGAKDSFNSRSVQIRAGDGCRDQKESDTQDRSWFQQKR